MFTLWFVINVTLISNRKKGIRSSGKKKKSAFVKTNALKKAPQFFPMLFFKILLVDHFSIFLFLPSNTTEDLLFLKLLVKHLSFRANHDRSTSPFIL